MVPIEATVWSVSGQKIVVVTPKGSMNPQDEEHFALFMEIGFNQCPDVLIVDLSRCPQISETTRDLLKKTLTQPGREGIMVFVGANSAIRETMIPTRIEALFSLHRTVVDAFSAFAPPTALHLRTRNIS